MMDYLHRLQDGAGAHLTMASLLTGRHQEFLKARLLQHLRNGCIEVTTKILNCFVPHVVNECTIPLLCESQLMIANESSSLIDVSEVQAMPIKHRPTSQYQTNRVDVVQREIIDGLQPLPGARAGWRRTWSPLRGID
jgi:hypothetical protein